MLVDHADQPLLYHELASWWPLLSAVEDYAEEATLYHDLLSDTGGAKPQTLLELGSGGGNNAFHLKTHYRLTLVDRSPNMLAVSRDLNPECEHIAGDMRTVRLARRFDAVFVHDAIMYATDETALRQTLETAAVHCRPDGVALFAPDCVRETFRPATEHGGHDRGGRSLRYLTWEFDPDPSDTEYGVTFVYLLRESDGPIRVESEVHRFGVFARDVWLRLLEESGFHSPIVTDRWGRELFVCSRR